MPQLSLHWLGPLAMVGSVVTSWFAFSGTAGLDTGSTFSMWVGAVSILLMAWSFVLALRVRLFERFWGGLDSMYRGHRWAGALAIPTMFLHTQIEPETDGAAVIPGASNSVAEAAEGLAETKRKPLGHNAGQFAFVRLRAKGMAEPHPFTVASGPSRENLEFYIRHLGDWSDRLPDADLLGVDARVEGPYGQFEPISSHHERAVWIAGGVGITPFLAALDETLPSGQLPPVVLYACKSTEGDPLVDLLRDAHTDGRIELHLFASGGRRLTADVLDELFPDTLTAHHVALCGPSGLVTDMAKAASARGCTSIETEDFDIRQGFGPDRSREIDRATRPQINELVTRTS